MLPRRQVIQSTCVFRYRGPECGYVGVFVDLEDNRTPYRIEDACSKRLSSCRVRFDNQPLPFGGFPGARRYGA